MQTRCHTISPTKNGPLILYSWLASVSARSRTLRAKMETLTEDFVSRMVPCWKSDLAACKLKKIQSINPITTKSQETTLKWETVIAVSRRIEYLSCSQARKSSAKLIFLCIMLTDMSGKTAAALFFNVWCPKEQIINRNLKKINCLKIGTSMKIPLLLPSFGGFETWTFNSSPLPSESRHRAKIVS